MQNQGVQVTALDISPKAVEVMNGRGVLETVCTDIFDYRGEQFDTLLLLMNGIGLCGTITVFRQFLKHAHDLLKPGGQIIFDSSDVSYLYEGNVPTDNYFGEIAYQYIYKGKKSEWFKWLYIDSDMLIEVCAEEGWAVEILAEDDMDAYLARLMPA